ncbi:MAG: hypothetical protein KIS61_05465, partial [Candidatus Eremiobacteraeota bacterium]|nr:hypothetical protein [Candidatus Eremiobacteraeota bacterium]
MSATAIRWVRQDLPQGASRVLIASLESLRSEHEAPRCWVLLLLGADRYELIASVGDSSPERVSFVGRGPDEPQQLTSYQARALSPFRGAAHVFCWPLSYGLLLAEEVQEVGQELLDKVQLVVERLGFEHECQGLRKPPVSEDSELGREAELRSAERRAESLHLWYRQ